jgi:RimJ/RimL family protein N-acetyltransferase
MAEPIEITLRDVIDTDVEVFFSDQQDREAAQMAAVPTREREPFFAHWARIRVNETGTTATVVADGRVAGNVVSWEADGQRWVGYWISRPFWGRGVATRALGLLVEQLRQRPLYAHVAAHNRGSVRVLEKCGFRPVGAAGVGEDGVEELTYVLEP